MARLAKSSQSKGISTRSAATSAERVRTLKAGGVSKKTVP
jgi:hypothetical protein